MRMYCLYPISNPLAVHGAGAPERPSSEAMGRLKGEPSGGCSGDAGARTVSAAML